MLLVWALYDRLVYKWEMEMGAAVAQRIALAATGQEGHPTTVPFCAPMSKQSEDRLSKKPTSGFRTRYEDFENRRELLQMGGNPPIKEVSVIDSPTTHDQGVRQTEFLEETMDYKMYVSCCIEFQRESSTGQAAELLTMMHWLS